MHLDLQTLGYSLDYLGIVERFECCYDLIRLGLWTLPADCSGAYPPSSSWELACCSTFWWKISLLMGSFLWWIVSSQRLSSDSAESVPTSLDSHPHLSFPWDTECISWSWHIRGHCLLYFGWAGLLVSVYCSMCWTGGATFDGCRRGSYVCQGVHGGSRSPCRSSRWLKPLDW